MNFNKIIIISFISIALIALSFSISPTYAQDISSKSILELTNDQRTSYGLNSLTYDSTLQNAALAKAKNMLENKYFEHNAKDGRTPWDFILANGYDYQYAGENLAMDFSTPEGAVSAWMESPSHRENILNPKYQDIAIGVVKGEFDGRQTSIIVQMFGTKQSKAINALDKLSTLVSSIKNLLQS